MGFPPRVRRQVQARSEGTCEGCGQAAASDMHHRKFRSRGGRDTVENALHLCGMGGVAGCHGRAHTEAAATDEGWSLNSWDSVARPVLYRGGWVVLTADGGVEPISEPPF